MVVGMDLVVFDMSRLRFVRAGDRLQVQAGCTGTLAEVPAVGLSGRESVFRALDAVLERTTLPAASGDWVRVGLYNPLTQQVAVGQVPSTEVFSAPVRLELPVFGAPAFLVDVAGSRELTLQGTTLTVRDTDATAVRATLAAH